MKILQIAPFDLPTRGDLTCGGTQRIVSSLDSSYVNKGLDSFVVATADSIIEGKLLPTTSEPLLEYKREVTQHEKDEIGGEHYRKTLEHILSVGPDIIHDQARFVCSKVYKEGRDKIKCPIVVSIHSNVISESEIEHLKDDENIWVVALSENHRKNLENHGLNVGGMVYNGLDLSEYPFEKVKKDFMFSIGRIIPDKGQDIAIRVAKRTGKGLVIAGKILPYNGSNGRWCNENVFEKVDRSYEIKDLSMIQEVLDNLGSDIVWVNGLRDDQKKEFYKYATCLIAPSKSETFGLTVIEAFATGTPVIVLDNTSLPEIVTNGENGYLVNNEDEMVEAVRMLGSISPLRCRQTVEKRFSLERQVDGYLKIYGMAINSYDRIAA